MLSGGSGAAEAAAGSLEFDTNGRLMRELTAFSSFTFVGAQTQSIDFDFGTSLEEGGNGYDGTTNFASDSTTNDQRQDGYAAGSLSGVTVDWSGALIGTYTNGQSRPLGRCP